MKAVVHYIFVLPILYFISILPFWLLYGVADFFYLIIYYVAGYRKKVVRENLKNSFPEKNEKEIKKIERKFYRYLSDLFLEAIKTFTITPAALRKRYLYTDAAVKLFRDFEAKQQSYITVMGHMGNWEMAGQSFAVFSNTQFYIIYHPLSNKHFEKLMYKMRTRLGNKLYAMKDTIRGMIENRNTVSITAFVSDQTPAPESAYWTTFLRQDTPVFWGTEKIAMKMNYPVVYISFTRPKRGYYTVDARLITDDPKNTKSGQITETHTRWLEEDIIKQPEIWLWSHRRWKHKRRNGITITKE